MAASALTGSTTRRGFDVSGLRPEPQSKPYQPCVQHGQPNGPGALRVTGAGMAVVRGKTSVAVTGHGVGSVWVRGADTLTAQGFGRHTRLADGVIFRGFRGTIIASGDALVVTIIGGCIDFTTGGSWSLRPT